MKRLDRYILQTFFVSLLVVGVAMVVLSLLLVVFIHIDEFLEVRQTQEEAGFWAILWNIGNYYFYKFFDFFRLLAAPWILFSAAATLARFNRSHELASVKAAGISMYRVLWPLIVTALLIDVAYIVNQEVVVPRLADKIARDPDDFADQGPTRVEFLRDKHHSVLFAPIYDPVKQEMLAQPGSGPNSIPFLDKVYISLRDAEYNATAAIEADRAVWDPQREGGGWILTGGRRYHIAAEPVSGNENAPNDTPETPVDFYPTDVGPDAIQRNRWSTFYEYLSYGELKELARHSTHNRRNVLVVLNQHVTAPIMLILTLLLGLPFVAGREEGSYLVSIAVAFLLQIGVLVLSFAFTASGNAGHIAPVWAAWIPTFLVLLAGILAMESLKT